MEVANEVNALRSDGFGGSPLSEQPARTHREGVASEVAATARPASDDPVVRRLADDGLYLGLTAWTDPSLVGALYAPTATTAEQRLRFYASRYPITEVDSTFYHPLAGRTAATWVARTPPGFLFDVKAFRLLTQHPTPPSGLWRDLRDTLSPE